MRHQQIEDIHPSLNSRFDRQETVSLGPMLTIDGLVINQGEQSLLYFDIGSALSWCRGCDLHYALALADLLLSWDAWLMYDESSGGLVVEIPLLRADGQRLDAETVRADFMAAYQSIFNA